MEALDPNICPSCGNRSSIQELGKKHTWQPVELCIEKTGELGIHDYGSWEWGDDTEETGYHCRECNAEWFALDHLLADMKLRHALLALTEARAALEEELPAGTVWESHLRELGEIAALIAAPQEVPS